MFDIEILEPIRDKFASEPLAPILSFPQFCDDPPKNYRKIINQQLKLVPKRLVAKVIEDPKFLFHNSNLDGPDLAREAKVWVVTKTLEKLLPRHRLQASIKGSEELRCLEALSDVEFDNEGLVPATKFKGYGSKLKRRGYCFTIMPTVTSPNSSYWLTIALRSTGSLESSKIRLDPFMWGPEDEFNQIEYKMWSWGERLSWTDLMEKSEDAYGEWIPSELSLHSRCTQYVWIDEKDEAHLEIEELPLKTDIEERGTRYCHAIYDKRKSRVVHLDGAIRILTDDEWEIRNATHLKDTGKVGKRLKIFRIDEPLETHRMSTLCMNFFIWNYDIARFFGAKIPEDI